MVFVQADMAALGQELMLCKASDLDLIRVRVCIQVLMVFHLHMHTCIITINKTYPASVCLTSEGWCKSLAAASVPGAAFNSCSRLHEICWAKSWRRGAAERALCCWESASPHTDAQPYVWPLAYTHQVSLLSDDPVTHITSPPHDMLLKKGWFMNVWMLISFIVCCCRLVALGTSPASLTSFLLLHLIGLYARTRSHLIIQPEKKQVMLLPVYRQLSQNWSSCSQRSDEKKSPFLNVIKAPPQTVPDCRGGKSRSFLCPSVCLPEQRGPESSRLLSKLTACCSVWPPAADDHLQPCLWDRFESLLHQRPPQL